MPCFICNELLHDTITYGLIPYVSHINTISPPKVVTQLLKPNKDLSISPFLVIDNNSTKMWKLRSFGFMLLAQAILPCVKDMDKFDEPKLVVLAPPTYVLRVWI
jgi:hypothetical protein